MGKWKFAQVAQAEDLDGRWLADLAKRAAKLGHDVAGLDIEELEELIRGPADEPELAIVVGPEDPLREARALVAKVTDPEIAEMVHSVEEAYELLSKALDLIPESMTDLQEEVLSWVSEEWGSKAEAAQIERQESYRFDSWPITFAGFEPGALMAKAEQIVAAETAADPETVRHTQRGPWAVTMRGTETKMDLARLTAVNDLGDSIYITKKVVVPAVISYFGPQTQPGVMRWEAHLVTAGEDRVLYTSTDPNAVSEYLQSFVAAEAAEEVSVSDPIVAQVGEVMRIGSGEHYVVDMTNGEVTPKVIALPTIVTTTDEEVNPMDVLDNGVDFEAVLAERGGLSEMLLRELRGLAKQRELSGYSRLSRGKLIGFLNGEPVAPTHIANVVAQVKAAAVAQRDQPVTIAEQVAEQVVTYADRVSFARKDFQPFEEIVDLLHVARADTRYKGVEHHKIQMRHVDESGVIKEWDTKTINSAAWIGHGWQARLIKVS
ncbi:MAG TPA: hypothetical protein VMW58_01835 [Anaerolineae bacterium]|nr:hypothetical protein [Anaerolineae bacterium]